MANEVEELCVKEVSNSLSEFQRRFAQLPDIEEPPQTFLQLLGQESEETDWNTILSYFLDPSKPHGFGTDLLEAFLSLLEENSELEFDFDALDFGELTVKSEWMMRDLAVRPDITIYSGRNWFIIIEMKIHAPQSNDQTNKYVCSKEMGNIDKSEFSGEVSERRTQNYVYLAPESAADAEAPEFVNISWREVVETLEQFEHQSHRRYPAKSHAQLNDFLDTIRKELNMIDENFEKNQMEKMRLYAQYADEIDDTRGVFDEWQESVGEGKWRDRFLSDFRPSNWGEKGKERWQADPSGFGQIYRTDRQTVGNGWRQSENRDFTTNKNEAEYRIDFIHRPENREVFRNGEFPFQIYCAGMVPTEFKAEFERQFGDNEYISNFLEKRNISHKGKMYVTEKDIYTFETEKLPDSYYETLRTAFEDYQEIADDITEVFEATLDEIESK